jgi:hypothetical protein
MAYSEIYLTLARVVRTFDKELCDTTEADVIPYHARIQPYPKGVYGSAVDGRGEVKVKVRRRLVE